MLSFKQEAELDLFNEQGFGPAFGRVLLSAIYTLIEAGYPSEAVLVEMYMSNEMSYTYKKMAEIGLIKQVDFHSQTSQYGAMSKGIRYRKLPLKPTMNQILKEIQEGEFTKEWSRKLTKLKFKAIKFFATWFQSTACAETDEKPKINPSKTSAPIVFLGRVMVISFL